MINKKKYSAVLILSLIILVTLFSFIIKFSNGVTFKAKLLKPKMSSNKVEKIFADEEITYKDINTKDDKAKLNLYVFKPRNLLKNKTVVFFFGGGWRGGDPEQFFRHCKSLAQVGYGCVSVEYRTSEKYATSPMHCLEDARDAIKFIFNHGKKHGLSSNVWAGGQSAGGHLAASLSMSRIPEFNFYPLSVKGLILLNPIVDTGTNGYSYERVKFFSKNFSPMHSDFVPKIPMLFLIGSKDHHVSPEQAKSFTKRFKNIGASVFLKIYEGQEHGFFNESDEMYNETLKEIIFFLDHN